MVGSGLKKLAAEYNMKVDSGVAYGAMKGYAAVMNEGAGYKGIVFSTSFPDGNAKEAFTRELDSRDLQKEFRVNSLRIGSRFIQVDFMDTIGTMKRIRSFLAWFLPLLERHGASDYTVCPECGAPVTQGKWVLIEGAVYYLHDSCASRVQASIQADNTRRAEEDTGSYASGTVGAVLGALAGAIVWAILLYAGYIASLVGLLIGWLADKGYNLCKGRQGKAKVAILIVAVILGVVVGTLLAESFSLVSMISSGELLGFEFVDIPLILFTLLLEDGDYLASVGGNILSGLFFAALGVFFLLRQAGREVAGVRYQELK